MVQKLKCHDCSKQYYDNMLQTIAQDKIQCVKCANDFMASSLNALKQDNVALRVQMQQLLDLLQPCNTTTPSSPSVCNIPSRFLPPSSKPTTPLPTPNNPHITPTQNTPPHTDDIQEYPSLTDPSRNTVRARQPWTTPRTRTRKNHPAPRPAAHTTTSTTEIYNVPTSNSFNLLIDLENDDNESAKPDDMERDDMEIEVISDSLGRNLSKHIGNRKRNTKRTVYVYPGAKLDHIEQRIKSHKTTSKKAHLVVLAGGNDVYEKSAASEEIIQKYSVLLDSIKDRANNATMIAVLPRMKANTYTLSRAIRINSALEKMCARANIRFIDPWENFIYNPKLYKKDGTHINSQGLDILASYIIKQTKINHKNFC